MSNGKLAKFQYDFTAAIIEKIENEDFINDIVPSGEIKDAKSILKVHRDGYIARLTEALGESYEGVWFALGDELFFETCELFISKNQSTFYNLNDYGESFPQFLRELSQLSDMPFISDLARFDWQFKEIFHTKQHESIAPNELARLETIPESEIIFGDAMFLFEASFSIYPLWCLRKGEEGSDFDINQAERLILYKQNDGVFVKSLSENQFGILNSLKEGKSLEGSLQNFSEIAQDELIELFQFIGSSGIVCEIKC